MKRFAALLSALCLVLCFFSACKSNANVNIQDVHAAVLAASPIENPVAVAEDDLIYEMDLSMDNIDSFVGTRSNTSGNGDTVLVIKAKSGCADAVKAELEAERDSRAEFLKSYEDFAVYQQKAEAGRVVMKGDVILLVIGGNDDTVASDGAEAAYADIDKAIDEALK